MIPEFIKIIGCTWPLLPPGIHNSTLDEIQDRYVTNSTRLNLFEGLKLGLENLFNSGCPQVFLDGSYVTAKPVPKDYEVCWDMQFVNPRLLDPVFSEFANERFLQKQKFLGEYLPMNFIEQASGKSFLDFFQTDRDTGKQKGIIRLTNYLKKGGSI